MISVSLHKVSHTVAGILAHSSMQISSRAVMFWGCRWATWTFNSLQRFSMGLRSGDWLGHSRTLKCFLRSHSFVARAVCLGSLSCWKTQPRIIFNALCWWKEVFTQNLTIHGPIHSFLYTDQSSWSLCRKTAPKHDVSTPMLHSRYGVLWMQLSILSPPNTTSWVLPKSSILVSSDHMTFSQTSSGSSKCSLANFRRAWTCTGLSRGTRLALEYLSPWRRSVLLMVAFVTWSQLSVGHSLGPPVWFWDFCSQFLWSFWPHGVRSCVEPQIEGDYQWSCMSSIF